MPSFPNINRLMVLLLFSIAHFLCLNPVSAQTSLPGLDSGIDSQAISLDFSKPVTPENANAMLSKLKPLQIRALLLSRLNTQLGAVEANTVVSRLSDKQARALLLAEFNTQAQSPEEAGSNRESAFFYHATQGAFASVTKTLMFLPNLVSGQIGVFANFYQTIGVLGLAKLLGYLFLVLMLAYGIELLFRRLTKSWARLPKTPPKTGGLFKTLGSLFRRLVSDVGGVLVFVLAAHQIGNFLLPPEFVELFSLIELYLIGIPRLAWSFGRFILAPQSPAYRIVRATDADAKALVSHIFWFAMLMGFSVAILDFNEMNGVYRGELRLGFWLNNAVHLYIVLVLWRYRDAMADMMRSHDPDITPVEEWIARSFPYFGIAVSVGIWWVVNIVGSYGNFAFLATIPHYKTLALALLAPAMDTTIRGLVRHAAPPMTGDGAVAERAYFATKRSYIRIGRVVVFGLVLFAIAGFWGVTPTTIASAGVGPRLAALVIKFLIILSVGYLLYELVGLYINQKLAAEITATGFDPETEGFGAGDGGGAGGSRLSTVLPLFLLVSRSLIAIVFILLALSNIGIDITPLLAGAGIIGLAIGFGAQKLVSDVVSGVFFLIDDAFRIGEYVDAEGPMGTVEKISIRSLQLRHHKGAIHTVPYGEIPRITNYSRDWVIMKLRFTVPFDTDPQKVKKIFKKIGASMLEHPELGEDFLQPFKSQGVLEVDDVGMVIRGKFMAKPGKQFMIRKEIFNRVNTAFAEEGIDFARREVRVAIPGLENDAELTEDDKAAIAAAAGEAARPEIPTEKSDQDKQR